MPDALQASLARNERPDGSWNKAWSAVETVLMQGVRAKVPHACSQACTWKVAAMWMD